MAFNEDRFSSVFSAERDGIQHLPLVEARIQLTVRMHALARLHNTLAPINTLPQELLLVIFNYVAVTVPSNCCHSESFPLLVDTVPVESTRVEACSSGPTTFNGPHTEGV